MSQEANHTFEQIAALEFFMEQCTHVGQNFFEEGKDDSLMSEDMIEQRFREEFAKDLADFSRDEEIVFNEDQLELAQNIYERVAGDIAAARTEYAGNEWDCDFYNYFQDEQDWFQERLDYLYVEAEDTPEFKLAELAEHRNESIRKGVANHSNTISGTLDELVEEFPYEVAHNENASSEALAYAAEQALYTPNRFPDNEAQEILEAVAWKDNTNSETLSMIAGDESDENTLVRVRVAGHPNASVETLEQLAHDEDGNVRFYVARNANTPSETLDILSNDENSYRVRMVVASNENASEEALDKLSKDENIRVSSAVATNPSISEDLQWKLAERDDWAFANNLAKNPNTSEEVLLAIANAKKPERIAGQSDLSAEAQSVLHKETMMILGTHENDEHLDYEIRGAVAMNPDTPAEVLMYQIKNDENALDVRREAALNPSMPAEGIEIAAKDEDWDVRIGAAYSDKTSTETLHKLSKDEQEEIRETVAENLKTSPDTLKEMLNDEDDAVREAAAENLGSRSEKQTSETKNKYAAKFQKTSEKIAEKDSSAELGD